MPSLAILEGLIGTACAIACLYYARLGALAGPQNSPPASVPWHSALGDYARKNPFAAVFGALALGFLVSSWSMYIAPRAIARPAPRVIEKWHVVTKTVSTADPAQASRIAALQTTINADTATIASQQAELARLKQLLSKPRLRASATTGENAGPTRQGTTADLNRSVNPANAATGATAPATSPQANQNTAPAPAASAQPSPAGNETTQTPATTPPH